MIIHRKNDFPTIIICMIHRPKQSFLLLFLAILIGFISGSIVMHWIDQRQVEFPIFTQAYNFFVKNAYAYQDTPEENKTLEYGMINGLFQAFGDPHTRFIQPATHEIEMNTLEGKFGGIGATIEKDQEGNFVLYPASGSPAALAGILNGDRITQVNDLLINADTSMDVILAEIRGPVKSKVKISLFRPQSGESLSVSVVRQEFSLPSVTYSFPQPGTPVAVIKVSIVASTTPDEIEQAMQAVLAQPVDAIVLDLRDNAGGFVDAGVKIAGMYLPAGDLLGKKFRDAPDDIVTTGKDGKYLNIPLFVFVNHGTASAAEIITGALQANHRAMIIGTNTYGKDSIQLVFDLDDGSSVHITNAKWFIPGLGYDIGEQGVQPDILLSDDQMNLDTCLEIVLQHLSN